MRIEILIDNEEPRIYSLDRPKLVIGSHDTCDIVVKHKSISRKHIIITALDNKFFVSDQGSTNGTFINEQKLVPGRSSEFTSFFPVRLGNDVLLTLLTDDEARDLGPESELNSANKGAPIQEEGTRTISISNMQKSSTASLVQKRSESVSKRKTIHKKTPPKKKGAVSNYLTGVFGLLLIGGVAYYQFVQKKPEAQTVIEKKVLPSTPVVVDTRPVKRVKENEIPSVESVLNVARNPKCTQEIEKYLCVTLPNIFQGEFGTVLMDKNIIIVGDGKKYINDAMAYLKAPTPIEKGGTEIENSQYKYDLGVLSLMLWIMKNVPENLEKFEGLDEYNVTVALVDMSGEAPTLVNGAVFVPESFLRLRKKIQPQHFTDATTKGISEFAYAFEHLRFL